MGRPAARSSGRAKQSGKAAKRVKPYGEAQAAASAAGPPAEAETFLDGLGAALRRRARQGGVGWKLEDVAAALERALASLPDGAAKQHIQQHLTECAAVLHSRLAQPEPGSDEPEKAARPKAAKRARTAKAPSSGGPEALLFDSCYQEVLAGESKPSGADPLALATARCPPPAPLLGQALGIAMPAEGPTSDAVLRVADAVGVSAALAALVPGAAEGLACFAEPAESLAQAASAAQEPRWHRGNPHAPQLWRQLDAAGARLFAGMELVVRQERAGGGSGASGGEWCLHQAPAGLGRAAQAARRACANAIMLRAMTRYLGTQLAADKEAGVPGQRSGAAAAAGAPSCDAAMAAQAARDLRALGPLAAAGLAQLLVETEQASVQASPEGARCFMWMVQALAEVQEGAAAPHEFLLRLVAARKAAEACRAAGLPRKGDAVLAAAARGAPPPELADGLRRQPPSAVVGAALAALAAGGPQGLAGYLAREPSSKVLLALARKLSEGDDAEGGSGVVPLADGDGGAEDGREGTGADELLFFVSTDADATMFGRDWAANESESEEEGGSGAAGVALGELSGDEEPGSSSEDGGGSSDSD